MNNWWKYGYYGDQDNIFMSDGLAGTGVGELNPYAGNFNAAAPQRAGNAAQYTAQPAAAASGTATGFGTKFLDNIGGISSAIGAGASLWDAYNQGKYNKEMLKEQRRYREMAEAEFNDTRAARKQTQASFNKLW